MQSHYSLYDASYVDYQEDSQRGNFDVIFDQKLYEPPQITKDLEIELQREIDAKLKKK